MPIPTYTPGYPPDGSSLGQTKSTIRNNLDGTFQTLGVDHINNNGAPGSQPAGYHSVIHSVPQASNPSPIAGYGQLYSKTINSYTNDQALFWETGAGLIQQLTTNLTPTVSGNRGYSFIPGGFIVQWGSTTAVQSSSSTTVDYLIAFPNNVFSLQCTIVTSDNSTIRFSVLNNSALDKFITSQTSSSHFTNLYWFAIGN